MPKKATTEPEVETLSDDQAPEAVTEVEAQAEEIDALDLARETLSGDVRDAMLMRIRTLQKPWEQMTEAEQYDCANGIDLAAKALVRGAMRAMLDFDFPRCVVTLGEVKIKGEKGIEAKITTQNCEENRNVLGDYVGQIVLMIMASSDDFMGERSAFVATPDQPELPECEPEPDESDESPEAIAAE